jgi:hypothetical protein
LSFAHNGDAIDDNGGKGFVARVAFDACDGGYEKDGVRVTEAKDGVLSVELGDGLFGDEELAAVGAAAGGTRTGVGHGKESGLVKGEVGVDLVLEVVAGVAGTVAHAVTALNHEIGDDAMEGGAVVEGLMAHFLQGLGVGPVFGAFGETDEVGYCDGRFFFKEFAGESAHGGVDDDGWAGGDGRRLDLAGSARGVRKLLGGWGRLRLPFRGEYAEGQDECEDTKRHAVFDSNKQATADTRLEQSGERSRGAGDKLERIVVELFLPDVSAERICEWARFFASHSAGGITVWRSIHFM